MIAADIDKFYSKVIKDFIVNLNKNQYLVRQLQQNNIYLRQIEQKMSDKVSNASTLFDRLTHNYNEIEKEMLLRYASNDDILYKERQNRLKSQSARSNIDMHQKSKEIFCQEEDHHDPNSSSIPHPKQDDSDDSDSASDQSIEKIDKKLRSKQINNQSSQLNRKSKKKLPDESEELSMNSYKKRKNSENSSFLSLSQADQEYVESLRRLRQNAKIHILGVYDNYSKKHDFKEDRSEIKLENVFVKVQGLSREIFIKDMVCVSKKRNQNSQ